MCAVSPCRFLLAVVVVAGMVVARSSREKRQIDCAAPANPSHGSFTCASDEFYLTCHATCDAGYAFEDKSPQPVEHLCDIYGQTWLTGPDVPPCVPVCITPCENGGTCDAPDHCRCLSGYSGPQCHTRENPCHQPANPQNGQISCQTQGGDVVCTVSCLSAAFKFESQPAAEYRCTPDGTWTPSVQSIPSCVQDFDVVPSTTTHAASRGAMCSAWGQEHYRTFDGKVFTFTGHCTYTLLTDCSLRSFAVNVLNDPNCQPGSTTCKRELDIFIGTDMKINLRLGSNGAPVVQVNGASVAPPTAMSGVVFQMVGRFLTVQSPLGFLVKWDGKESVYVTALDPLRGKTCGLCGVWDGNQGNDLTLQAGGVATTEAVFGTSWKVIPVGATCPDAAQQQACSEASASARADSLCAALLSDASFAPCHSTVDVNTYIEACKFDCCGLNSDSCTCKAMEAYSQACMDRGIALHWRRNNRCPVSCSNGKMFQECGSPCQPTCDNPHPTCTDTSCVDGCFCPPGYLENGNSCVPADQCPCSHNGKVYQNGETFPRECNNCTCKSGSIDCTRNTCSKRCSAVGDPHYLTFDGKNFDFMGNCSYYLLYDKDFDVIVDNIKCGENEYATCTKSVSIDINGMNIKMDHNHRLFINGREITQLPYEVPGLKIFMVSSLFMQANLANGVQILWDGRTRVYVTAPSTLMYQTQGLCGTFDNNQNNDFLTKELIVENNPNNFGNSWKTQASCHDVPAVLPPSACDTNPQRKTQAQEMCNKLRSAVFSPCHAVEAVDTYLESCLYDMCACTGNLDDCLCPTLGVYADTCAAKGVKLNWRSQITECMIQCPAGQVYEVCGNPCQRTCGTLAQSQSGTCTDSCVEGCTCPAGQTLDDHNQCVDVIHCPCVFDGREYPAGYATLKGAQMCTCIGAQWKCQRLSFGELPPIGIRPLCPENAIYTDCASQCPATCQNFGDVAPTCTTQSTQCQAGCHCLDGFVLNGDKCINSTQCPCHSGGREYTEGDIISMDCNKCTCHSQKWVCETNPCPTTCSAIGDSHYTTFDGKEYQFQGACDYVLVKSQAGQDPQFQVTTENVACGSGGVTCSRKIEVTVGVPGSPSFFTLQLVRGQSVKPEAGSPFTVSEVGEFVYITTPFGLSIQWDKGTRVYVRLENRHRGHVEGLCGNFNSNQLDDFKGPSGGPVIVREHEFADSWKLHDYCAPPITVEDTCLRVPQRQPWAKEQCSILSSDVFAPCHPAVDPAKYLQLCVFDTCACNQGGDCQCLCTAVAAYAHECANHGFPIAWRTPDLCPLECEECKVYNPCVSPCPKKTCQNRLTYNEGCRDVEHTCFEGCDLPPCPVGQVYASLQEPITCIPEQMCDAPTCDVNGRSYREGERIVDDAVCNHNCEICNCRGGTVEHISYAPCDPPTSGAAAPATRRKRSAAALAVCGEGEAYHACLWTCVEACPSLRDTTPQCQGGATACVPGCLPAASQRSQCAAGEKRSDADSCVPASLCPCLKPNGDLAKPFETWKNPVDQCSDCSCHHGQEVCSTPDPSCKQEARSGAVAPPSCYPGMDRAACPATCPTGQYCDGVRCVALTECPCPMDKKIVRARDVMTNTRCETCQCLNGQLVCLPKTCTSCQKGVAQLNLTTCSCECACPADHFRCSSGRCIPASKRCDGVADCEDDELSCAPAQLAVEAEESNPLETQGCLQKCPEPLTIRCPSNAPVVEVVNACGCKELACLASPLSEENALPSVCRYRHNGQPEQVFQTGEQWTDGPCAKCACVGKHDGTAEVLCQRQHCPQCQKGEERVSSERECCGRCQPQGCVDSSGRLIPVGSTVSLATQASDPCYTRTCELDLHGGYVVRERHVGCDLQALPLCKDVPDDFQPADNCGCPVCLPGNTNSSGCQTCSPQPAYLSLPNQGVGFFKRRSPNNVLCANPTPLYNLMQCAGPCGGSAQAEASSSPACSCCQPSSDNQHHVTLACQDGSRMELSYTSAEACNCGPCSPEH